MAMLSELPSVRRIAILDDDIRFIRMVERTLFGERIELVPITTIDLTEATGIIASGGFSLAMIDIMMYGQAAGFDVVERLRSNPETSAMRILVTSAARREIGRRVEFLRAHRCSVLLKPFAPDDLLAMIRDADPIGSRLPEHAGMRVLPPNLRLLPRRADLPAS